MHPDDWCILRHDADRVLTFLGPELAGLWPGPPKGYRGYVPGPSWRRPVVVVRAMAGGAAVGGAAVAAVCAQCGLALAKLLRCGRCKTARRVQVPGEALPSAQGGVQGHRGGGCGGSGVG